MTNLIVRHFTNTPTISSSTQSRSMIIKMNGFTTRTLFENSIAHGRPTRQVESNVVSKQNSSGAHGNFISALEPRGSSPNFGD